MCVLSLQNVVHYYDTLTQIICHGLIYSYHKYCEYYTISGTGIDTDILRVSKSRYFPEIVELSLEWLLITMMFCYFLSLF